MVAVALVAIACGDPEVPRAVSSTAGLVTATPLPQEATPTASPTPTSEPTADPDDFDEPTATPLPVTQPGLYSDRIRVAVIADVVTGGTADGLFAEAWNGALAWRESVNQEGGIGGRLIELDLLDARLSNHREKLEQVCDGDYFAIIGSQSLGDYEGAELLGTADCNVPDFPGDVHGARRAESPVTFLANPFLNDLRQSGPAKYLTEQFPDASQSLALFYYTSLQLQSETERLREMLVGEGMNVIFEPSVDLQEDLSGRIVTEWEESGAEALVWNADPGRLISLLGALDEPPAFVLCELACYSQAFLTVGGEAVEGVYAWIPHSPFDSSNAPGELVTYRFWLNGTAPDAGWSEVSLQAWLAGRLFEESFNRLLAVEPEAFTRDQLVQAARTIDFFTANEVLSFTNPAAGEPTPCFALMVVERGRWVQVHPQPPRDLDCAEENLYPLVATRNLGLTAASSTSSEAPADPEEDPVDLENPEEIPD